MNEIAADRSGVVEAILVDNGQPVEYGSALMTMSVGRSDRG
jgi:biotin carboxyl carrier protein